VQQGGNKVGETCVALEEGRLDEVEDAVGEANLRRLVAVQQLNLEALISD
jgi:hypothetical protein